MDSDGRVSERVIAGRYRLLAPLGSGGMGTVWRSEDVVLRREVAVKEVVFPPGLPEDEREVLRERTRREARAAARLDHPSAVTVFDVVEENGAPFLVMELVEARTLAEIVRTDGPLTPAHAARVGLAVLGALQAAHAQGIVHRDVKPGNVLMRCDDDGVTERVVLTDFGIATSTGDASITSTGLLLGSPSYIAPERARGHQPGPASDLWSLGATLFTAVEGRPPFDAGDAVATVTAVVTGEHAPFVAAGPLVPVLEGLLERDPAQRLDAESAAVMLEAVARGEGDMTAPRTVALPASETTARRANRTAALPLGQVQAEIGAEERAATPPRRPAAPPRPARPVPPQPGRRRTLVPLVLAIVLLVGAAVGGIALLTSGDPSDTPDPTASAPSDGTSPDSSGAPAGWSRYVDPVEGWALHHPPGWTVSDRRDLKQFRDEETRRTLRVGYSPDAPTSAVQAAQAVSQVYAGALGNYQEVGIEPVRVVGPDGAQLDAADLEFTYTDGGADLHVVDRRIVVGGESFSLYWQVLADDFASSLGQFGQIADTFDPNT